MIKNITISDFGCFAFQLPIHVTMEMIAGEWIAEWSDVELYGIGGTEIEAVESLKDSIADLYSELEASRSETLSQKPLQWKTALEKALGYGN